MPWIIVVFECTKSTTKPPINICTKRSRDLFGLLESENKVCDVNLKYHWINMVIIFQQTVLFLSEKFFHCWKIQYSDCGINTAFSTWVIAKKITTRLCTKDHDASKHDRRTWKRGGVRRTHAITTEWLMYHVEIKISKSPQKIVEKYLGEFPITKNVLLHWNYTDILLIVKCTCMIPKWHMCILICKITCIRESQLKLKLFVFKTTRLALGCKTFYVPVTAFSFPPFTSTDDHSPKRQF